jgi:hypothetical protein
LQGVIGRVQPSLNGDSRLNLRLIALLNGILFLGIVGRLLRRRLRPPQLECDAVDRAGCWPLQIGYAGTFCGNLIKAAVADNANSSPTQRRCNSPQPHGIANALKKIGGSVSVASDEHNDGAICSSARLSRRRTVRWQLTHCRNNTRDRTSLTEGFSEPR